MIYTRLPAWINLYTCTISGNSISGNSIIGRTEQPDAGERTSDGISGDGLAGWPPNTYTNACNAGNLVSVGNKVAVAVFSNKYAVAVGTGDSIGFDMVAS